MANEILDKWGSFTALTISLHSTVADGTGRQATQVTDASPSSSKVWVIAKVTTGTSPTANSFIEFYVSRADDDATELATGSTGTTDAAWTPGTTGEKSELEFLSAIQVNGTSDVTYICDFIIDNPGTDWRLVVCNETGATLNTTSSNHEIGYRTLVSEIQ